MSSVAPSPPFGSAFIPPPDRTHSPPSASTLRVPHRDRERDRERTSRTGSFTSMSALCPVAEDDLDQTCFAARRGSGASSSSAAPARAEAHDGGWWAVDEMRHDSSKAAWASADRVVLVLGSPPPHSLDDLLKDASLRGTHILIAPSLPFHPPQVGTAGPSVQLIPPVAGQDGSTEDTIRRAIDLATTYRKARRGSKFLSPRPSPTAPFDAIVHFLPPSCAFEQSQALQKVFREGILTTMCLTAMLAGYDVSPAEKRGKKGKEPQVDLEIPLVHVLPYLPPPALPKVMERYLLSLVPMLAHRRRPVVPRVVASRVWESSVPSYTTTMSVPLAILLGVLQPQATSPATKGTEPTQSRLYLGSLSGIVSHASAPLDTTHPLTRSSSGYTEADFRVLPAADTRSSMERSESIVSSGSSVTSASTVDEPALATPLHSAEEFRSSTQMPAVPASLQRLDGTTGLAPTSKPYFPQHPSRLSYVETFNDEDESPTPVDGEEHGSDSWAGLAEAKGKRSIFSWGKKAKAAATER